MNNQNKLSYKFFDHYTHNQKNEITITIYNNNKIIYEITNTPDRVKILLDFLNILKIKQI